MPLPEIITSTGPRFRHNTHNYAGPFYSTGGYTYVVLRSNSNANITVWRSTDPGTAAWTQQSTAWTPIGADLAGVSCAVDKNSPNVLRIAVLTETTGMTVNAWLEIRDFTMYNGTTEAGWGTPTTIVNNVLSGGLNLTISGCVLRQGNGSDFNWCVIYNGEREKVMGVDYERVRFAYERGAGWVSGIQVDTGGENNFTGPNSVVGASERVHVLYERLNVDLRHRSLKWNGSSFDLDTAQTITNNIVRSGRGVSWVDGANTEIMFVGRTSSPSTLHSIHAAVSQADPSFTVTSLGVVMFDSASSLATKVANEAFATYYHNGGAGNLILRYKKWTDTGGWDADPTDINAPVALPAATVHISSRFRGDVLMIGENIETDASRPRYTHVDFGTPSTPTTGRGRVVTNGRSTRTAAHTGRGTGQAAASGRSTSTAAHTTEARGQAAASGRSASTAAHATEAHGQAAVAGRASTVATILAAGYGQVAGGGRATTQAAPAAECYGQVATSGNAASTADRSADAYGQAAANGRSASTPALSADAYGQAAASGSASSATDRAASAYGHAAAAGRATTTAAILTDAYGHVAASGQAEGTPAKNTDAHGQVAAAALASSSSARSADAYGQAASSGRATSSTTAPVATSAYGQSAAAGSASSTASHTATAQGQAASAGAAQTATSRAADAYGQAASAGAAASTGNRSADAYGQSAAAGRTASAAARAVDAYGQAAPQGQAASTTDRPATAYGHVAASGRAEALSDRAVTASGQIVAIGRATSDIIVGGQTDAYGQAAASGSAQTTAARTTVAAAQAALAARALSSTGRQAPSYGQVVAAGLAVATRFAVLHYPLTLTLKEPSRTLAIKDPERTLVLEDPERTLNLK